MKKEEQKTMKEKITKIASIIVTIIIIGGAIMFYPWFVEVNDNGETICSNLMGHKSKC